MISNKFDFLCRRWTHINSVKWSAQIIHQNGDRFYVASHEKKNHHARISILKRDRILSSSSFRPEKTFQIWIIRWKIQWLEYVQRLFAKQLNSSRKESVNISEPLITVLNSSNCDRFIWSKTWTEGDTLPLKKYYPYYLAKETGDIPVKKAVRIPSHLFPRPISISLSLSHFAIPTSKASKMKQRI